MSKVKLVLPSIAYRDAYRSFYEEWIESGENIVPWVVERDPSDFEAYVAFLYSQDSEEKVTEPGRVPASTIWLADAEGRIVGAANIRHRLNEKLFHSGGHIGYGIRPSARRNGYATALLRMSLDRLRALGVDRALLVCDDGNVPSARTIARCGGRFENTFTEPDGSVVRRYWIDLAP